MLLFRFHRYQAYAWPSMEKEDDSFNFREALQKLESLSRMSWAQIRHNSKLGHLCEVKDLIPEAKESLKLLTKRNIIDPTDSLYRFAFGSTERLWGIKYQNEFHVLWWDPYHDVWRDRK